MLSYETQGSQYCTYWSPSPHTSGPNVQRPDQFQSVAQGPKQVAKSRTAQPQPVPLTSDDVLKQLQSFSSQEPGNSFSMCGITPSVFEKFMDELDNQTHFQNFWLVPYAFFIPVMKLKNH